MGFVTASLDDGASSRPRTVRFNGADVQRWRAGDAEHARKMTVFAKRGTEIAETLEKMQKSQEHTAALLAAPVLRVPVLEPPEFSGIREELMVADVERTERHDRAADAAVETAAAVSKLVRVTESMAETSGQMAVLLAQQAARADRDARVQRVRHWVISVLAAAAVAAPFVQAAL